MTKVGIIGGSGFAGEELIKLLSQFIRRGAGTLGSNASGPRAVRAQDSYQVRSRPFTHAFTTNHKSEAVARSLSRGICLS